MNGDLIRSAIKLSNSVKRILDQRNKEYECSGAQIRCLHEIYRANARGEEINQKDLEINFNLQKSSMSGLLKSMEEKNLIERINSKRDSRYKAIILTEKGKKISDLSYDEIKLIEEKYSSNICIEDIELSLMTLSRIIENIEGGKNDESKN